MTGFGKEVPSELGPFTGGKGGGRGVRSVKSRDRDSTILCYPLLPLDTLTLHSGHTGLCLSLF